MDIQPAELNEVFELVPMHIPGWVSPVKPANLADGGIPKSLYDGQAQGLECLVDPWKELQLRSWTMAADDRVDLYVNDDLTPVTGKTVAPGEEQLRVRLYVPHGRLRNGVNRLHYKVTRVGGNSEDSRDLNVLYYRRSPGEPAPEGLDLVIPSDVLEEGVSAQRAAQGVEFGFTYSNGRAYDRVRFQIGDETVEWEITDAAVPVTKTLFTDTFQQVGDNPNLLLDFVVFDQLGNFSRSSTKPIDVHLGRTNLLAAILREIPRENNDDPNTVDLAKLNGDPLSALIHLVETIWKVGDSIKLVFTAELNGSVVATHEETSSVTQVPTQFVWSIPNNKIIANSTVKVVYEQVRGGAVIATSTPASAQVIGEGAITLTPPTLVAPAVNPIDLWLYASGITVRAEFLAALAGDKARLIEINPAPGATPFPAVEFNANKRTNTILSQAFLAEHHGKQLTFRWALIRDGKEIARSGSLVLNVNRIADGDARFPTPVIAGQTGRELDVTKLVAIDKLSIAAWPLQVASQYVWLRYDGFNSSGAPVFFDDLNGVPHNDAQGLTRPALVDWLKALKHGTAVTITFRVNFSGRGDLEKAVTFPVRSYTIKAAAIKPPKIVSVRDSKYDLNEVFYTAERQVMVVAESDPNVEVEIINVLDGNSPISKELANGEGISLHSLTGLNVASYRLVSRVSNDVGTSVVNFAVVEVPTREDFDAVPDKVFDVGVPFNIPSMTITSLNGNSNVQPAQVTSLPGKIYRQVIRVSGVNANVRYDFRTDYSGVSFWYSHVESGEVVNVYSYDSNSIQLESKRLVAVGGGSALQVVFSKSGIRRIEVHSNDVHYNDSFVFLL